MSDQPKAGAEQSEPVVSKAEVDASKADTEATPVVVLPAASEATAPASGEPAPASAVPAPVSAPPASASPASASTGEDPDEVTPPSPTPGPASTPTSAKPAPTNAKTTPANANATSTNAAAPAGAVRARDARSGARTPEDIAAALVREKQVKAKRENPKQQRVALERALAQLAAKRPDGEDGSAPTGATAAVPAPAATKPVAAGTSATAGHAPTPGNAAATKVPSARAPAARPASTEKPAARAPITAPPNPSSVTSTISGVGGSGVGGSGVGGSGVGGTASTARAPRTTRSLVADLSTWLIFWALVVQVVTLVFVARTVTHVGNAVDHAATAMENHVATTTPTTPTPASPLDAAPRVASSDPPAPTVASLGEGRIVCARSDGKLVVLKRDATSGELVIERVYALEEDAARNLGDESHRAYSGLYLSDVEHARRASVEAEERAYRETLAHSMDHSDGLQRAEEAARALGRAGGFDRLMKRLDDPDPIARRTSAIVLAELGYYASIPRVVEVLEATGDSDLVKHLAQVLHDMTGIQFDVYDGKAAIGKKAKDWWEQNKTDDLYARRPRTPK